MAQKPKQLSLPIRTWGGKRKNAGGRKPPGWKPAVAHRSREPMHRRSALHVTMRMAPSVYNLRSKRSLRVIEAGLRAGAVRFGVLVVQTSIQGNHIHFLVEADDARSLGRAMKGLAIRMARGLNRMMGRDGGQVFAERYHAHLLRTPTEVRNAIHDLRHNRRHHLGERAALLPTSFVDPYTSDAEALAAILPPATLWILKTGWLRARGPARAP